MMRRLLLAIIWIALVRSQLLRPRGTPRFESIDDLPEFYRMLTAQIGQMVPAESQPYHQYYAQLLQPYYPYSKAQLNAALLGNLVTQSSPLNYELLPPGYGYGG
ncbi:hypothetical protein GCK32_008505 [Trichostrongylus colubriformis]|uniref:Uncharacterized protein n=1 Tax=Trichostrongylus colubriformis TaxID=6319 RepID=A0AAN8FY28_TRICO